MPISILLPPLIANVWGLLDGDLLLVTGDGLGVLEAATGELEAATGLGDLEAAIGEVEAAAGLGDLEAGILLGLAEGVTAA